MNKSNNSGMHMQIAINQKMPYITPEHSPVIAYNIVLKMQLNLFMYIISTSFTEDTTHDKRVLTSCESSASLICDADVVDTTS